jgi:hypothetical protein
LLARKDGKPCPASALLLTTCTIVFLRARPRYVDEMRGLADGSGTTLDQIWIANLTPELESLLPTSKSGRTGHCTDIFAHSNDTEVTGRGNGSVALGHNEDWSEEVKPLWYFSVLEPIGGVAAANFSSCAGMSYPGTILGYGSTWNAHGIYSTQNSLFPSPTRAWGLSCAWVHLLLVPTVAPPHRHAPSRLT